MSSEPIYREMHTAEKNDLLNLWLTTWPGEHNEAYFRRYFYGDREWLPYYTQVAEVDGKIVSSVQICKRTVWCGGTLLTMGGIANVATLPEYRGKGINGACMERAIHVMEADAMDFSLLFTGIPDYYQKYGYCRLNRQRLTVVTAAEHNLAAMLSAQSNGVSVRRATSSDLPRVRQLYTEFNYGRSISVDRWEAYWRDWMRIDPANPPQELTVAVGMDGSIVGYLLTGTFSSAIPYQAADAGVRVLELAVDCTLTRDMQVSINLALLSEAASRIGTGNAGLILETALTPEVNEACMQLASRNAAGSPDVCLSVSSAATVRLLRPEQLLRSLCITWSERWFHAGRPKGVIQVDLDAGSLCIDATGSMLSVVAEAGATNALRLTQEQFVGLLFGAYSPEAIVPGVNDQCLPEALFTYRGMIYYGKDGF